MKAKKEPKSLKDIPKKFVGLATSDYYLGGLRIGTLPELREVIESEWSDYVEEALRDGDSVETIRKGLQADLPPILATYEYKVSSTHSLLLTDKFLKECELNVQREKEALVAQKEQARKNKLSTYRSLYEEFGGKDPSTLT